MNPLKRASKGGTRVRNLHSASAQAQSLAVAPSYHKRPTVSVAANGEKLSDPFDYFRKGPFSDEDELTFTTQEQTFMNLMLMKNDYLTKIMWREQDYYSKVPYATPMLID